MTAHELDVAAAVCSHPYLVKGTGKKSGKGGNKGNHSPRRKPQSSTDHVLLGNKHFKKAPGKFFFKHLRIRGIFGFRIQNHNTWILSTQFYKRFAISLARGNHVTELVFGIWYLVFGILA